VSDVKLSDELSRVVKRLGGGSSVEVCAACGIRFLVRSGDSPGRDASGAALCPVCSLLFSVREG
jgi:hypothetical protein